MVVKDQVGAAGVLGAFFLFLLSLLSHASSPSVPPSPAASGVGYSSIEVEWWVCCFCFPGVRLRWPKPRLGVCVVECWESVCRLSKSIGGVASSDSENVVWRSG